MTISLALLGYLYTYWKELAFAHHKDQLERVDRQLRELYGPLYALASTNNRTYNQFRQKYRHDQPDYWEAMPPPTDEEARAWRLWMQEVFMKQNLAMEEMITKHSDLLVESEMPEVLLALSAHVAGYKPVLKLWEQGDFSQNTSILNFPKELTTYAEKSYTLLKNKQLRLLGELEK